MSDEFLARKMPRAELALLTDEERLQRKKAQNRFHARKCSKKYPEKRKETQKKYRESHQEVIAEQQKIYYENNKDKLADQQ